MLSDFMIFYNCYNKRFRTKFSQNTKYNQFGCLPNKSNIYTVLFIINPNGCIIIASQNLHSIIIASYAAKSMLCFLYIDSTPCK